ncbi:MAG: hypothetical protein KBD06_02750 [Candidatus Pacebacteria bacterium]|nr:hypothetical protein [Candidatus Paceibacterota bacterium]
MIVNHEDFIVATVEGQTRAMNRSGQTVQLDYRRTIKIFRIAATKYAKGWDMVDALEFALDMNRPFTSDDERHGYKSACGIEFYRRKVAGINVQADLDRDRPFVSREQDM